MTSVVFAVPGDIETPTGGYAYARHLMTHLPAQGVAVRHLQLPAGFPFPDERQRRQTADILAEIGAGEVLLVDGLAFGAFDAEILAAIRAETAVLLHHPLGLEAGLSAEASQQLIASEKAALAAAKRVIVTSPATAATVAELFGYPPPHIHVAEPGVESATRATGNGEPPHILSVGSLTPRKGHAILVGALDRIRDLPWRCTIAGPLDLDRAEAAAVAEKIHHLRLTDRVALLGALPAAALDALYASADLFALASHYEGYGMVFAEAMARGLPVVATTGGAVKDTVPAEAGILVEPGDEAAFAAALRSMVGDAGLRQRYADGAWSHAATLPRWADTARKVAAVLQEVNE